MNTSQLLNKYTFKLILFLIVALNFSCKKFLDEKPDKSLVIPRSIAELQGILDQDIMSINYPVAGEIAHDNAYYSYMDWQAMGSINDSRTYVWDPNTELTLDWSNAYRRILNANVVLSIVDGLEDNHATVTEKNDVKGSALFYRAMNLYELAQLFSPQYSTTSASSGFGLPLKTSPDVNDATVRSTVQETYDFIINDLKASVQLLPPMRVVANQRIRPSKVTSFALLARTFLVMGDYINAGKYADSALQISNVLMDYNNTSTVTLTSNTPFKMFNEEVLLQAYNSQVNASVSRVDTALFNSYASNDLRKVAFWRTTTDGWWRFKGNYFGAGYDVPFCGIATDEVYLIRAECYARNGKINEALTDLNFLLSKRWKTGLYTPYTAGTVSQPLNLILEERRKELCFRPGLRWSDIRRLNLESIYAKTLRRRLNGTLYELPPNDLRYTFLIPPIVVSKSGIQQNPR